MKRSGLLALILLAWVGVGGCVSQAKDDASGLPSGAVVEPLDARTLGYDSRWITGLDLPRGAELLHAVVVGDLLLTVESPTNLVSAVSLRDGSPVWRRVLGEATSRLMPPVRIGEHLVVASETKLWLVNPRSGVPTQVQTLEEPVHDAPAVWIKPAGPVDDPAQAYAIFGGTNGTVFAHDIVAGYSKWRYQLPAGILVGPVVEGQSVFAADKAGNFVMLRGDEGEFLWKGRAFDRIAARAAMTANNVYVPSADHSLYAINRATGRDRWIYRKSPGPLNTSPIVLGNSLYQWRPDRVLVSLDPLNGEEVWTMEEVAKPISLQDKRLLLQGQRTLMIADNATGGVSVDVPTAPIRWALNGPDNSLVLVSPGGRVQRLDRE